MAQAISAQGISFAAPYAGLNFKDPLASMDPSFSPWMSNIIAENQYCRVRQGMEKFCYLDNGAVINFLAVGVYSDKQILALGKGASNFYIYDLSTFNTPTMLADVTTHFNASSGTFPVLLFNNNLFFFSENISGNKQGVRYDGSSFTAISLTTGGGAGTIGPIFGAASHKGRMYIFTNRSQYFYFPLEAVQGDGFFVNLSSLYESAQGLAYINSVSSVDGVVNDVFLAFGNSAGEVLIYNGDYPGSSTWGLVAKYKTSKPLFNNAASLSSCSPISYEGDALVPTQTGLVSLRQLMETGTDAAYNKTVSTYIDDLWSRLAVVNTGSAWWGIFYPDQKKIIIITNGYIDQYGAYNTPGRTYFILNLITGSWSYCFNNYDTGSFYQPVYVNNNVYYGYAYSSGGNTSTGIYKFEGKTNYQDDQNYLSVGNYTFDLFTAWSKYKDQIATKKVNAVETFVYTDFSTDHAPFHYLQLIIASDFGREISDNDFVVEPLGNGYQKLSYSLGVSGVFFQVQITGSTPTSTYGYKLFSLNIIFDSGGPLS